MKRTVSLALRGIFAALLLAVTAALYFPDAAIAVFGPSAVHGLHTLVGGTSALAVGAIVTGRSVGDTPQAAQVRDVSDSVTYQDIAHAVPFDQLLRRLKGRRKEAGAIEIEFQKRSARPDRVDTVTANAAAGAAAGSVTWTVANAAMWRVDDTLIIPSALLTTPVMLVTATTNTTVTVVALPVAAVRGQHLTPDAMGTVPAITAGTKIGRIAPSKTERHNMSAPRTLTGEFDFNYVQAYDASASNSGHAQNIKVYGPEKYTKDKLVTVEDLRYSHEYNLLFGERSKTKDSNGNWRWTTRGITRYIDQTFNYSAGSLAESTVVDFTAGVFSGNSGSLRRVMLCDTVLMSDFAKIQIQKGQHGMDRTIAGVKTKVLQAPHTTGEVDMIWAPLFDEMGLTRFGVWFDMPSLYLRELESLSTNAVDNVKNGVRDEQAEWWKQKTSLEVGNLPAHGIVRGTA